MTRPLGEFDDDPLAGSLREAWGALDQLIGRAGVARMDPAAQKRLIAAVERRNRRVSSMAWAATAAAACLVVAIAFAWTARRSGENPPTAAPLRMPQRSDLVNETSVELQPWSDAVDEQLEATRDYALEIETRWRRRSDSWSQWQEEIRRLESEWKSTTL